MKDLKPRIPARPGTVQHFGHDWMAAIDDRTSLARLSIPGTHDAGASHEMLPGTTACQRLSIAEQLIAGVRFLDIRCRHVKNSFQIYHGPVFQQLSFHDVLAACADFLKRNSMECIVMSVKEEFLPSSNTRDFEQTFDDYVAHDSGEWLLSGTIPTLREAMGKIVLLRRFAAETLPKGIDAADWPVNATFTIDSRFARLKIQDEYVVKDEKRKWDAVQRLYRDAFSAADECLYLNFTSGYRRGILGLPNITAVSDFINPELENYFKSNSTGRLGISVMDFADTERCALIIATNF